MFAPRLDEIRAVGAEVIFVGNGRPEHARGFVEDLGLGALPVYTDPRRETYKLAGMKEGIFRTALSPKTWLHAPRAFLRGHRQTKTKGHPWQNGGVIVLDRKGKTRFAYVEKEAGALANIDDVIDAARAL